LHQFQAIVVVVPEILDQLRNIEHPDVRELDVSSVAGATAVHIETTGSPKDIGDRDSLRLV
jgi:hypothetical protein